MWEALVGAIAMLVGVYVGFGLAERGQKTDRQQRYEDY